MGYGVVAVNLALEEECCLLPGITYIADTRWLGAVSVSVPGFNAVETVLVSTASNSEPLQAPNCIRTAYVWYLQYPVRSFRFFRVLHKNTRKVVYFKRRFLNYYTIYKR
jgi:hypothetical protein